VGRVAVLVVVFGVTGWFGYQAFAEARRKEAEQRQDAENLRMARYTDVLLDLETVGNAGDETARARCRHAIQLLAMMEPGWYYTYRYMHPAPEWLAEPPAEKR
jgi:hypothetical protein